MSPKKLSFHPLKGNTPSAGNADVDADISGRRFITEPPRRRTARSERVKLMPNGFLFKKDITSSKSFACYQTQHRPENVCVSHSLSTGTPSRNRRL